MEKRQPSFNAGADQAFAELPVEASYLRWARGNASLRATVKEDPGAFFGGWRAMVVDKEGKPRPPLPLPIIERNSDDGKKTFQVYATNVIRFLPINHRTRYELIELVYDAITGRDKKILRATSKERVPGFSPNKQVFGIVYPHAQVADSKPAPAVLLLDKWSSFITFIKAEQEWMKIKVPENSALVRRYGSVGTRDAEGRLTPIFENKSKTQKGKSTPIEAIQVETPQFVEITDSLTQLFYDSLAWSECPRWNAEGAKNEAVSETPMQKFLALCEEIGLSDPEIRQVLAENGNNYATALRVLENAGGIEAGNAELEETDDIPY